MSEIDKDEVTNISVQEPSELEPTEAAATEDPDDNAEEDGNEDDDDASSEEAEANPELDRLMEAAMEAAIESAMQEESSKHGTLTVEGIPALMDDATSQDETTAITALEKIGYAIMLQEDFMKENLSAFDIPRLVKAAVAAPETLQDSYIQAITSFADLSEAARQTLVPHIPDLMPFLTRKDSMGMYTITGFLEKLAEEEPSSHELIVTGAKALYEPFVAMDEDAVTPEDQDKIYALIQTFDTILTYSRVHSRRLFLQACALELAIVGATLVKSAAVRKAAVSCMIQIGVCVEEVDAEIPDEKNRGFTFPLLLTTMLELVSDEDDSVSSEAIQFITQERDVEANAIVVALIMETPTALPSMIRRIGTKEQGHVGIPAEYALIKFCEIEEGKTAVQEGFKMVWEDSDIKVEEKMKIVSGLVDSFDDLRTSAYKGGLLDFISQQFEDEQNVVLVMNSFARLMEGDQKAGYQLLQTPGMLDKLVDIFDGPVVELRPLGATLLTHTFGSYNYESEAQRSVVTERLFNPNILPRILKVLDSGEPAAAGAAAKLVSEMIVDEDGTESWSYDAESNKTPPSTPMKDAINTEERAVRVTGLLKHNEAAVGALDLLCYFCWGNKRGFEIVQKAFDKHVPDGDVFFFTNLYGKYVTRHMSRMRRHVTDAAVNAGAVARVEALLELDHSTVEARSAAVEAYRVVLTADSIDSTIGRKNKRLPVAMKRAMADKDLESFKNVCWIIRLLNDDDDKEKNCFALWKESELASLETAQVFLHWLTLPSKRETLERPDAEKLSEEEFAKKDREYDQRVREIQSEESDFVSLLGETMTSMVPILAPYALHFVAPLLKITNCWNQNSQLMKLLEDFASNEDVLQTALVPAVRELLTSGNTDNNAINSWISQGPSLANAFYLAGILDYLKRAEVPNDEGVISFGQAHLQIFEALVRTLPDAERQRGVRIAFFASKQAMDRSVTSLEDVDGLWDAQAIARTLELMTKDYPEGLAILSATHGVYRSFLKLLQDHNSSCDDVATMVGRMGPQHLEALNGALQALVSQLEPPSEIVEIIEFPKKGKKQKQKKKKAYQPEIGLASLLDLFHVMAETTPEARKAIIDAGAIGVARKGLASTSERQKYAFKALTSLSKAEDGLYQKDIVQIFPEVAPLFKPDFERLEELVEFFHTLATPQSVQYLIDANLHCELFKTFTDFPTAVGNMALIIQINRDMGELEKGRGPMLEVIKESLAREDAFEQEENWGNAHALRQLITETEASAKLVVEAGAVDYVVRLFEGGDSSAHMFALGAALAATLARSPYLPEIRATLVERGVLDMITDGRSKCEEQIKACSDDDDGLEKRKNLEKWVDSLLTSFKIVNGEEVENFEEDFYL